MHKLRKHAPMLLLLIGLGVLVSAGVAFGADLQQVDVSLAKKSAKALAVTEKGLPAISAVVICFYIFQSFLFRMLSDMSVHKWAVGVVLNIMMFSAFFGGSVSNSVGQFRPKKNATQISHVVTDTYPGTGAKESATPSSSSTKFEVLATMFDNQDETLGSNSFENVAMIQTVTATDHTKWALDMTSTLAEGASSSGSGALGWVSSLFAAGDFGSGAAAPASDTAGDHPQKELYESVTSINSDEAATGLLGGALLYLNNAASSVAGDIGAIYDSKQMEDASKGDEAKVAANDGTTNSRAALHEDIFADSSLNAAAAANQPVTVVTMATYPGGVLEYGRHALNAIANPEKNYHASTVSADQITTALNASDQKPGSINPDTVANMPDPTSTGPGTVFANAKAGGFDGEAEGVHPQYFLRAHGDLQASECSSNSQSAGVRPGGTGSSNTGILNPTSNIPSLPIQTNITQVQASASVFGALSNLASTGVGNLLSSINISIASNAQLNNYVPTISVRTQPTTTAATLTQYDQLIAESQTNGMSHATNCLKTGKQMLTVASAISKKSGDNDAAYHAYLDPAASSSPGALAEAISTLAWSINPVDMSIDTLAAHDESSLENKAAVSDLVHHIVGYVSAIATKGGAASMNTKLPMGQESSWKRPDQKLETLIQGGKDTQAQANAPNADGSKKGFMQKASDAVLGGLQEMIAKYYQFALRLLVVLLAGMPFIALLTQVCIATTVAAFSYSLGMAIIPIWAVMNTGKLFSNGSAGDESYNGISSFPIVTIIVTTACLGAEVAGAKICQGEVAYYLTHITDIFFAQLEAISYAIGVIFTSNGSTSSFDFKQVLTPMMEAVRPFGICAAATIAPMLLGRLLMPGVIAPNGSASMVAGMASSAHEGGAAAVAGKVKAAAGAAVGAAVGGPAGAAAGSKAAGGGESK